MKNKKNPIMQASSWICIIGAALSLLFGIFSATDGDINFGLFLIASLLLLIGNALAENN